MLPRPDGIPPWKTNIQLNFVYTGHNVVIAGPELLSANLSYNRNIGARLIMMSYHQIILSLGVRYNLVIRDSSKGNDILGTRLTGQQIQIFVLVCSRPWESFSSSLGRT